MASNVIDDKLYFTGGRDAEGGKCNKGSTVWKYDPHTEKWDTSLTHNPVSRIMVGDYTCVLDKMIYVIGGTEKNGKDQVFSSSVDIYNPAADSWHSGSDLPLPLTGIGVCSLNGKVYVCGGMSESGRSVSSVYSYDPRTKSWSRVADMLTPRHMHTALALEGKVYAIGGVNNNSSTAGLNSTEVYNPETDNWSPAAPVPTQICEMASCTVDGEIYLMGGKVSLNAGVIQAMMKYNPGLDKWMMIDEIPGKLYQSSSSVIGRNIYLFGGSGASGKGIDRVWTYQLSDVILDQNIPDQELNEDWFTIDLSHYFKHAEGGKIEYSICRISDPTIVSTSIINSLLTIVGISEGEVQINLLAESGGDQAGDDFLITNYYTADTSPLFDIPSFIAWPNPAGNEINFQTRNPGAYMLTISSMDGRIILNQLIPDPIFSLNISSLSEGVYIIQAQNENLCRIVKLIKR